MIKPSYGHFTNLHYLISDLKVKITSSALAIGLHLGPTFVKNLIEVSIMTFHGASRGSLPIFQLLFPLFLEFDSFILKRAVDKVVILAVVRESETGILVNEILKA